MKKRISIIGTGSWGTAIGILLNNNGHTVTMWSPSKEQIQQIISEKENKQYLPGVVLPSSIQFTADLAAALESPEIVVLSVPSKAIREVCNRIKTYIEPNVIIVNTAKGLEESSLKTLSAVIEEELPQNPVAVLSGPSHAEEVGRQLPTTCVAASKDPETRELIQNVFMSPFFRVYTNPDLIGIELGGAMKNVIALAAGIADGLGYGDNTKAALMTRGIVEISRLGVKMGANIRTFAGLSGIGDLIVTCTSMHSRNRRAGILLGKGKKLEETLEEIHMVVEGVEAAKVGFALSKKFNVSMPIVTEVHKVLFEGKDPKTAVMDLMQRDPTCEDCEEEIVNIFN